MALGHMSATAAAREYLRATTSETTIEAVSRLADQWATEVRTRRAALLGDQLAHYRQRVEQLVHTPMSWAAAEASAFVELVPDAADHLAAGAPASAAAQPPVVGSPDPATATAPARFRPNSQDDLAPSGEVARIRANLAALRTLRAIDGEQRPATSQEQAVLARWSGWGAVPAALDPLNDKYIWVRDELAHLLDEQQMAATRRTVINAHYTDLALTQAIWDGVAQLGFTGGRVLEPGCGSGNFIAAAPDGAHITGVELDPTTAAIAAALHPHAQILAESFAATRVVTGSVDLAIGNVPFGDVRLHDKRDNRGNHAIHNHFILKALRATRPGGLVAVITSAYTMDATNPAARREMQQLGDLVGAVRLPSRAHARAAGTDALTDLLVFRRREEDRAAAPFDWEYTAPVDVDGTTVRINAFFVAHPDRVLGALAVGDGLYRHDELSVKGDPAAAPAQLREALTGIAEQAREAGLMMTPGSGQQPAAPQAALLPSTVRRPDGYLRANDNGTFSQLDDGQWQPYAPPKTQAAELRALLRLRDTAVALLEAEAASLDDTDQIDELRATLNLRYDAYLSTFGPVNRFTEAPRRRKDKATGRMVPALDEETGEPLLRRVRPPQGGFRIDPFAPVVRALEVFDEETQSSSKADIFRQRVVAPRPPRLGADTPDDAVAICLDEFGEVRLDTVAWLLGIEPDAARQALGTLVYDDPDTGRLEPAAAYLSGDVKTKLAIAKAAADEDARFEVNVAALTDVVPRDRGPEEITDSGAIKMGAPWIGAGYVQQFLAEILDDPTIKVEHGGGGMWSVASERDDTVAARSTWGTDRRAASEIAQHILEQREFVIKDTVGSGDNKRQVVNLDAIMAATEKAVEMRERFVDWVWEDAQRAAALVARYNDVFQRYVPRSYDDVKLSLPGLAQTFQPDPHQVAAVARIIHEPAVGLYHAVGAGKTASMIMGAMELRRLGLARKPVIVVPNQLLDQWTREFLRLYPQAKLLAASTEDLDKDRRRLMVARIATGDWDAIILTESAFEMLPMTPEAEQAYVNQQMAELDERINEARANGAELTLKRLETKKANREARLEDRLDNDKDTGIWWELTGIDYIFRDESHRDKNLRTVSNVAGMSIKGSQRAQQMDMKLAWLRERQPRWGTRATGTPIANSIVELYTEYRYLRPDLMQQQGITDVDSWLATYAEGKVVIEVTPDGGGLRNKTRLEFVNLTKLADTLHVFADVKTKDDLNLERPQLAERADGQRLPRMVVVQPSDELLAKVAELVARAADLRGKKPEPGSDNILKIVGEGAAAALDLRLVGLSTDQPQKLDVAADEIAAHYHANKDRIYLGPDGEPHPIPGAHQMAFCDLGTPSDKDPGKWTAYGTLRQKLVDRGVPREKIRFIHEATDDRQRAELFASCRDGRTAVLISSTEKGGTGVNVQTRLLALHHLDTPYRPCDLEQRDGRIDRRGNQNDEIHILRYVTERSLDAFKWQKVAYKSRQAELVLTGKAGDRSEDVGEVTLSYEEMKAASTGNPLLVDHAKAKAELARLERLERAYHRNRSQLDWTIKRNRQDILIDQQLISEAEQAIARRRDTRGNKFTLTVRGTAYTKRGEANDRLKNMLGLALADPRNLGGPELTIGEFAGFAIAAKAERMSVGGPRSFAIVPGLRVRLVDAPGSEMNLVADDLTSADLTTRLENRLAKLESVRDGAAADIAHREAEITRAEHDLTKPFRHADDLAATQTRFRELDIQVTALAAASEQEANAAERAAAGAPDPGEDAHAAAGHQPEAVPTGHGPAGAGQQHREPTPIRAAGGGVAEDRHQPPARRPATLPQVLAAAELTAQERDWLTDQIHRLTADPTVAASARAARDYDDFRPVFDPALEDLFLTAAEQRHPIGEPLTMRYLSTVDTEFKAALTAAAGHAVYEQIRSAPQPPAAEPVLGAAVHRVSDAPVADRWDDPPPSDPTENDDSPAALPETQRLRRGHPFYPPADLAATVPRLYATEHQADGEKVLHLHYFAGGSDWWLAEYDPATGDAYGYACLGGDANNAEWGYVNLVELEAVSAQRGLLIVERDLYWNPVPARQANLPGHRAPKPTREAQPAERDQIDVPAAADPAPVVPARGGPAPTAGDEPVTIEVKGDSVLVRGTDKADSQLREALAEAGFKWYRSLQCWGLPRTWHHETRMQRVAQLLRRMREHGRILSVEDPIDRRADEQPATGPLTLQTVTRADLRVGDQVQLWTTGADAYPWHGLGFPNDDRVLVEGVYVGTTGLDGRGELLDLVVTGADGRRNELGRRILLLPEDVPVLRAEPAPAPPPAPEDGRVAALRVHLNELAEQAEQDTAPLVRADELRRVAAWPAIRMSEDGRFFAIAHHAPMDAALPARWEAREATTGFPLTLAAARVDEDAVDALFAALSASGVDFAFHAQRKFPEPNRAEINRALVEAHESAQAATPRPPGPSAAPSEVSDMEYVEADPEPIAVTAAAGPEPDPAAQATAATAPAQTTQAGAALPVSDAPTAPDPALDPAPPSWAERIQILERGRDLVVTGTTGHPREDGLRGLLKQHRFRYGGAKGEWRYTGRAQDRAAAVGDIQRWLAAKDRAEAASRNPGPQLPPTAQQQRIIDAYRSGQTITVQALAGTGKTSTLLMLAADQPGQRIAYIAFNRSIADEAQRKFPRNVTANTAHGFARAGLARTTLAAKVDKAGPKSPGARWPEDWARVLAIAPVDTGDHLVEPETTARLVMGTIRTFRESADDTIAAAHLPKGTPAALAEPVLTYATQAWQDITDPAGQLLFDHDDYLKIWALRHPRLTYDVIFFDEAQDINPVLRKVIQDQPVQTVVVGDSNQSIYGFRGAIDALRGWPADVELPLTQSWRFGPAVAEVGNRFLGLLRSPWLLTGNPGLDTTIGPVDDPDAVLARTNAGAVAAVFDAFDAGRRVALVGGGQAIEEIAKAAKDLQGGRGTKHPELSRFANWGEVRAYVEEDEHAQSLRAFVRLVDRRGADGLLRMVRELIDEEDVDAAGNPNYDVIVSTVHKAKGREWNRVRVAEDFPQPEEDLDSKRVVLPEPEELRLAYVTVTRARKRLDPGSLAWIDDYAPRPGGPEPATHLTEHAAATAAPASPATPAQHHFDVDSPFTAVELATIRNAVADHAARFYGGPMGFGRDSAARYTSEGPLKDLVDRHSLATVWKAVAAEIDADESVLTRTEQQRAAGRQRREERVEELMAQAGAAFEQRDHQRTLELLDQAELVDPTHRPTLGGNYPFAWAELRKLVTDASNNAAPTPVPAQPGADPQRRPAPDTAALDQATVVPVLLPHPDEIDPHDCLNAEPTADVSNLVDGGAFSHPADRDPTQYAAAATDVLAQWHRLAEADMSRPWVQLLIPEQMSGHKLHVAATTLEQVRQALSRVWAVCQQAGLGLKAAGNEKFLPVTGKGLTIYLPRRDTIHRDASLVAAALEGYQPDGATIHGDTRLSDAVWHRYEFTHDPGHDVDLFQYRQLYQPADRPEAAAAEPVPATIADPAPRSPAGDVDRPRPEAAPHPADREAAHSPMAALDAWLQTQPARLRDGLPETARRWIGEQIAAIAAEPAVIRAALAAGNTDDLVGVVDRRLFAEINRSEGWHQPEARNGQFFTDYLERPAVQDALHAFARQAVYDAIVRPTSAADPTDGVAAGPANAAQLARQDTAPGVSASPAVPAGERGLHRAAPAVAGRQAAPGV